MCTTGCEEATHTKHNDWNRTTHSLKPSQRVQFVCDNQGASRHGFENAAGHFAVLGLIQHNARSGQGTVVVHPWLGAREVHNAGPQRMRNIGQHAAWVAGGDHADRAVKPPVRVK